MHRWCLLNLTVQGFSLNLTVRGVSNKHCLLTFFIFLAYLFKFVLGAQKNCLIEMVLLSANNICLRKKSITHSLFGGLLPAFLQEKKKSFDRNRTPFYVCAD